MSSESDLDDVMFGNWLDLLRGRSQQGPARFQEETLPFLKGSISFVGKGGRKIYLIVDHIEYLQTKCDQEYAFDFRLSPSPPPSSHHPQVGKRTGAGISTLSIPYGETVRGPAVLGYTFTSLNTLAQNVDNLRDFVLSQQEERDVDPLLDGDA